MAEYIMALDAGTTSNRCILFDRYARVCAVAQKEFTQIYPKSGYVEHNANEIWATQLSVAVEAMQKLGIGAEDIAAIGITNQRETTIVWDRQTGEPVYNAIVWQCRRTSKFCDELKARGLAPVIRQKTGLVIDAYFSATKLKWILDNVSGARERAERGELCFGTVDTWLMWKLSGGRIFATDYSNASRTMLFNINTLKWDEDILKELDIPACMLPEVKPSSGIFGHADAKFLGGEIPIAGVAGDQQSALFGQTCFEAGEAKNTYGTGCFLLMNTGERPVFSNNGLVTTVAWGRNGKVNYALEGSIFVAGAAIQWLRDEMKLIESAADSGIPLNTLRVDGGASANNYLMQTQADIINAPVARPRCVETTAMGAAFLAGLAVKYWADTEEIKHSRETEREFYPSISEAERGARTAGWNRAVKCAYGWAREDE